MFVRNLGTILLGVGFVMLGSAALIRDPTVLDANIGAGGLTLVGIPVGTLGLALMVTRGVYRRWHRRRGGEAAGP
jgi:hypothetical protein